MNRLCSNRIFTDIYKLKNVIPSKEQVTLVGGCFDLLHVGHVHVLEYAKSLGGILVVVVLNDVYIRNYKGPSRPIITDTYRAAMIASLRCVDFVYISSVSTSDMHILGTLKPQRIVFGVEHNHERQLKRREMIRKYPENFKGIKIYFCRRFEDKRVSTTNIISELGGNKGRSTF